MPEIWGHIYRNHDVSGAPWEWAVQPALASTVTPSSSPGHVRVPCMMPGDGTRA